MKKALALLLSCAALVGLLAGCGAQGGTSASPSAAVTSSASAASSSSPSAGDKREITDMAGRKVTIPANVKSVYCAVPTAEAMVSSLCPDKLVGWVNKPSAAMLKYLPEKFASLPVIGGWMGQKVTANMEDIVKLNPDVVIYMGTVDMSNTDQTPAQIEKQTGLPVIVVSSALADTAKVYRFLGDCLGEKDRAEKLASYSDEKLTAVKNAVAKVPASEKVNVYYAEGNDGLSTDPSGSDHTEILDFIGVNNVANVEKLAGMGMTAVTIEQVINWNPDVILISSNTPDTYKQVSTNAIWQNIKAVKDGRLYSTPSLPFNWFDRPPNIMRVLGVQWFASVIYPNYVTFDTNNEIKNFFSLFYNVNLTDDQVKSLIATAPAS